MHWTTLKAREAHLHSCWQGDEILVFRDVELVDQLRANDIDRVTLIHADAGDSPGEIRAALFAMPDRVVLLGATSGVAGRVLFERQAFWSKRNCIYWVSERSVAWPQIVRESRWPFARPVPQHLTLTPEAARAVVERSSVTGPHTWDQRKQFRIERRRPFRGHGIAAARTQGSAVT